MIIRDADRSCRCRADLPPGGRPRPSRGGEVSAVRPRHARPRCCASRRRRAPSARPTTSGAGRCSTTSSTACSGDELVGAARRPAGMAVAPALGARPDRGVPDLAHRRRRRRAVGPRGARARRSGASPARDLPRVDSGLRVDGDVLHRRGVPRRRRPVPRARLPAIKLHAWGDARADADLCQRLRDARRTGRRPDVRRLGRLRPSERGLPRPTRSRRPATAGTRSRCASSA